MVCLAKKILVKSSRPKIILLLELSQIPVNINPLNVFLLFFIYTSKTLALYTSTLIVAAKVITINNIIAIFLS